MVRVLPLRPAPAQPNSLTAPNAARADWGWANLGLHNPGNPDVVTPNIDALIAGGINLGESAAAARHPPPNPALTRTHAPSPEPQTSTTPSSTAPRPAARCSPAATPSM